MAAPKIASRGPSSASATAPALADERRRVGFVRSSDREGVGGLAGIAESLTGPAGLSDRVCRRGAAGRCGRRRLNLDVGEARSGRRLGRRRLIRPRSTAPARSRRDRSSQSSLRSRRHSYLERLLRMTSPAAPPVAVAAAIAMPPPCAVESAVAVASPPLPAAAPRRKLPRRRIRHSPSRWRSLRRPHPRSNWLSTSRRLHCPARDPEPPTPPLAVAVVVAAPPPPAVELAIAVAAPPLPPRSAVAPDEAAGPVPPLAVAVVVAPSPKRGRIGRSRSRRRHRHRPVRRRRRRWPQRWLSPDRQSS